MGREQELSDLHTLLQGENAVAIAAISGMGGIGKTELAVQYAWMHLRQKTYPGGVVWLKAREDVATQIVLFARSLPMPQPPDDSELAEKVKFYWRNWQDAKTLVILDDVQDYGALKPLLPVDPRFKILLTTRLTLQRPVQPFAIKVLSEEKAIKLLRAIVSQGRDTPDLRLLQEVADLEQEICHWLGYLPLGIELVGRYLARKPATSLATLWQRLQDKRLDAKALKEATPEMTATLGVTAAFELSWQELHEDAQQLAALLSLFALAEIPWTLVEACLPEADTEDLEEIRDESLLNLHLLEFTGQGLFQLHQLLREFFAAKRSQRADTANMEQAFRRAILAEAERSTETPERSLLAETTVLLPHLQAVVRLSETLGQETDVSFDLSCLAKIYYLQGRYTEAEPLYVRALDIREHQLGGDHPNVATSLNSLALLYQAQGHYAKAETLYIRALNNDEHNYGAEHSEVATNLNNLAALYYLQGRYAEAEPLYVRALDIREHQLGGDHPNVATSLNNLAELYREQSRYSEAEPLYVRALDIYERRFGADHYLVANSLNNLALLYQAQGHYAEAEPLYTRALSIREQQFGAAHNLVANSLNNLALLYEALGRYTEAGLLYMRAWAIIGEKLGADYSTNRTVLQNFLGFLQDVIQAGQTGQLSDHPMTQDLLRQMREGSGE